MSTITKNTKIEELLYEVSDPEIPVLSIMDMGIVRSIKEEGQNLFIEITPTYSGCPAMDVIGDDIKKVLEEAGYNVTIKLILSPAWTTDWITETGQNKLKEYGIAPPLDPTADKAALYGNQKVVNCPRCQSKNTKVISQFGSTACKALFQCNECLEPFDYFKCLK